MINEILKEINLIIDFGISKSEKLTREERISRMQKFREELSVEKYSDLFIKIENTLLDDEVLVEEKDLLISEFLNMLSYYVTLQESYEKFPELLKQIFISHNLYKRLCILMKVINDYDVPMPLDFEEILLDYFDFLENPDNEFFIHNCYSKIDIFNKIILDYLNKKDYNNKKFEDSINKPELISLFKTKINEIVQSRD